MLKSICYWYQAALLPVVFWALAAALRTDGPVRQRATLSGAVVSGILLSLFFGNTCWSKQTLVPPRLPGRLQLVQRMAKPIRQDSSLFTTQRIASHFIAQKYLYVDPPVPPGIDYVLLDLRDSWRETVGPRWLQDLRVVQRQVETHPGMHLVYAEDGLLLYSHDGNVIDSRALVERDTLPANTIRQEMYLAGGIKVLGFTVTTGSNENLAQTDVIRVTTYCTVIAPTNVDVAIRCVVQVNPNSPESEAYASQTQPLGQGIWPIARWVPGKLYADDFLIAVPKGMVINHLGVLLAPVPLTY